MCLPLHTYARSTILKLNIYRKHEGKLRKRCKHWRYILCPMISNPSHKPRTKTYFTALIKHRENKEKSQSLVSYNRHSFNMELEVFPRTVHLVSCYCGFLRFHNIRLNSSHTFWTRLYFVTSFCTFQFTLESEASLILETSFRTHNLVLATMFSFGSKLLLKCYLDRLVCY
jgi:hypothetical protein